MTREAARTLLTGTVGSAGPRLPEWPYLLLLVRRYRVRYLRAEAAMTAGLVAESERLAAAGSRRRFPSVVASPSGGAEDGTRRQGGDLRSGRGISVGLSELFEAIASSTRPQLRVTGV